MQPSRDITALKMQICTLNVAYAGRRSISNAQPMADAPRKAPCTAPSRPTPLRPPPHMMCCQLALPALGFVERMLAHAPPPLAQRAVRRTCAVRHPPSGPSAG